VSHTSCLVKYGAHHIIRFELNFSLIGRNVLFCSRHYGFDAADVLRNNSRFMSDVIYSCARTEVTDVHMHEVDLLFECVLKSDVLTIVDYICTAWSLFFLNFIFLFTLVRFT